MKDRVMSLSCSYRLMLRVRLQLSDLITHLVRKCDLTDMANMAAAVFFPRRACASNMHLQMNMRIARDIPAGIDSYKCSNTICSSKLHATQKSLFVRCLHLWWRTTMHTARRWAGRHSSIFWRRWWWHSLQALASRRRPHRIGIHLGIARIDTHSIAVP